MSDEFIGKLDAWAEANGVKGRSEALRRLVALGLKAKRMRLALIAILLGHGRYCCLLAKPESDFACLCF